MRACEVVALDKVGLHSNSVQSHSGNVRSLFTRTWAAISLDAYLTPFLQLSCHYGVNHLMLLLVIGDVAQI